MKPTSLRGLVEVVPPVAKNDRHAQNSVVTTPGRNGGTLHPYPKGVSGNPGGRPKSRCITEAYNRVLELPAEKLKTFGPKTVADALALAQVRAACRGKNPKTDAAREIADRVEGKAATAEEDRGVLEEANATAQAALVLKYLKDLGLLRGK